MFLRRARLGGVALAAVATITAALAAMPGAQAAGTPAWKVDQVFPASEAPFGLAAVSTQDVWMAGTSAHGVFTARWNGAAWQPVPAPAVATSAQHFHDLVITGTSPSNAWIFASLYTPSTGKLTTVAEHWTGHSWVRDAQFPASVVVTRATAPSTSGVWAFGSVGSKAYAGHYVGRTWVSVPFPAGPPWQVSGVSASDIWAISSTAVSPKSRIDATIEHWNGSAWRPVGLPAIHIPASPVPHYAMPFGIADFGPGNVWAEFGVGLPNRTDGQQLVLAHLTAHGWSVLTAPASLSVEVDYLTNGFAGNARTGLWLAAFQVKEGAMVLVGVTGRTWRVVPVPNGGVPYYILVDSLTAIPGSGDLLGIADNLQASKAYPAGPLLIGYGI